MIAVRLTREPIFARAGRGVRVDIGMPDPEAVDFRLMAVALSKQARFDGRHEGLYGFSAAQHAVQGAQAILNETRDLMLAALFLLRDGHQWLLGERSSPAERLLCARAGVDLDVVRRQVAAAWDEAIYEAAGLIQPSAWTRKTREFLDFMDMRMTRAEAIELFGPSAAADFPNLAKPKTTGALHPWPAAKAELAFLEFLERAAGARIQ
jgi:hypothetical protein